VSVAVTALILAGGRATRMGGVDKTALIVDGETIFARQMRVLETRVAEILLSVGAEEERGIAAETQRHGEEASFALRAEKASALRLWVSAANLPLRTVADRIAGAGPLAGVHAGLVACATPWMLVVAGDMPHLDGALIDRMIAAAGDDIDAVGIRIDDLPEPLFCLLRVSAARAAIAQRFAEGKRKASELLTSSGLRVAWLEGIDRAALTNINTPDDLR
jgi:molybdopterin-guanine dinucleotide biosynthesis protein A